MELAVAINAHPNHPNVSIDTIESIFCHATKNVLMLVDSVGWNNYKDIPMPCHKMEGFYHGCAKSPYRNMALAMNTVYDLFPNSDWFCYCESDVLFASDAFKKDLKKAEEMGIWMMGCDGHIDEHQMPIVESMIGEKTKSPYYLLGACQFFHKHFLDKLKGINFFERLINLSSGFSNGFFPLYTGFDISEHMYPTLCRHYGGNIGVFSSYDAELKKWHGSGNMYPIRWKPEIDISEISDDAVILHPIKDFSSPIRILQREKRKCMNLQSQIRQLE